MDTVLEVYPSSTDHYFMFLLYYIYHIV